MDRHKGFQLVLRVPNPLLEVLDEYVESESARTGYKVTRTSVIMRAIEEKVTLVEGGE